MVAAAGYDNSFVVQLFYCCVPEVSSCVTTSFFRLWAGMHDDILFTAAGYDNGFVVQLFYCVASWISTEKPWAGFFDGRWKHSGRFYSF
jgi:hypothetical protein